MSKVKSAEELRTKAKEFQEKAKSLLREAEGLEKNEAVKLVEALRRAGKLDEVRKIAFSEDVSLKSVPRVKPVSQVVR